MDGETEAVNSPDMERCPPSRGPTHAFDILAFVEAQEIPPDYFDTDSYQLTPAPGGEQDYEQLREELRRAKKVGIACVEIHARQHLAVLSPQGKSLVLNTLRWASEGWPEVHEGPPMIERIATSDPTVLLHLDPALALQLSHQEASSIPAAPAEHMNKYRKTPDILVEEMDYLPEDDDDYLAAILSRNPHPLDGNALRRRPSRALRQRSERPRGPRTTQRRR